MLLVLVAEYVDGKTVPWDRYQFAVKPKYFNTDFPPPLHLVFHLFDFQ
jgi:hypothetical protein